MNKFLITTFCMVFLIGIGSVFALEEFSTEPISLDEFIEEYLPDYTLQKRIPLEGIGRAYTVAKDSGDIVAITEIGDQFKVHYFNIEGNLKWTKDFDKVELYGSFHKVKSMDCEISDNGETICLYITPKLDVRKPTGLLGIINTILSKKGDVLYTKLLEGTRLIPSPDGKYLYKGYGEPAYIDSDFHIYHTDGRIVNIQGFDNTDVIGVSLQFVSLNKIFAYVVERKENIESTYFQLLQLSNEVITTIWEYEISPRQNLALDFDGKVKVENNRIAVCGHALFSKLYVFNFAGELLYFEDINYQSFDFVNDDKLFFQNRNSSGRYSKLINLSTKEIRKENIFFGYEKYIKQIDKKTYDYDDFDNVLKLNNLLMFSIKRYQFCYPERKYYTIILNLNDWKHSKYIEHNVDFITVNNENFFVFEKYYENPEILILQGGGK